MIETWRRRRCSASSAAKPRSTASQLAELLVGLGRLAGERPDVASVDINPLIVDAPTGSRSRSTHSSSCGDRAAPRRLRRREPAPTDEQFRALFEPRGVLVAGASTHPGKFGFVALHNLLARDTPGGVFAHQPGRRGGARHRDGRRHRRSSRRRHRPRLRVHAGRGQPRPAAGVRARRASGRRS